MKNYFLFLYVMLLCSATAMAQSHDVYVYIRSVSSYSHVAKFDPAAGHQVPQIPDDNPTLYMWGNDELNIYKGSIVVIRFFDMKTKKLITAGEADQGNNMSVTIKIGTDNEISYPISAEDRMMTDLNVRFDEDKVSTALTGTQPVAVTLKFTNPSYKILSRTGVLDAETSKGEYHASNFKLYQAFGADTKGFWVPTLQFSSNLKSDNNGIPFAALPIGAAWGFKRMGSGGGYVGFSVMVNWMIYSPSSNTSTANSVPDSNTSTFTVSSFTTGAIIDINNVFTIGYAYGKTFKNGQTDPGSMFVLGFGPKLIDFMKGGKK